MGNIFSTDNADEPTPMGISANQMRAGLGPAQSLTLRRSISDEEASKVPDDLGPDENGVSFRLQNAPAQTELKVEIASVEPEARYSSILMLNNQTEDGEPKETECRPRSFLEVQLRVSSTDGTIDATVPMKLEYYAKQHRSDYPGYLVGVDQVPDADLLFFGRGRVEIEDNGGALRVVDARSYQGQNIEAIGLDFTLGIADGELLGLGVSAVFDLAPFGQNGKSSKFRTLYTTRPVQD